MTEDLLLYPKELPPDGLLLWRFIGGSNILMANGDRWKKHSMTIRDAFNLSIPVNQFIHLSKNLFDVINPPSEENDTHTVDFADLAQRFALDAVGSSVLGHDFDAIRTESLFVKEYNGIMHDIANPLYLIMPFLEKVFPRKGVIKRMDNLVDKFRMLLQAKRNDPGDDMMTFMLKEPTMSEEELRDNMVVLFIAGHVSQLRCLLIANINNVSYHILGYFCWRSLHSDILPCDSSRNSSRGTRRNSSHSWAYF
jgi:cytochrome P450